MKENSHTVLRQLGHGPVGGRGLRRMLTRPQHFVRIVDRVNDVHLPGLIMDAERGTLELNRKALMSLFFSEEHLYQKILASSARTDHRQISVVARRIWSRKTSRTSHQACSFLPDPFRRALGTAGA